jgi:hypothetical protein
MVNKTITFVKDLAGGEVDQVIGEDTVQSDVSLEIQEVWYRSDASLDYSLRVNGRKLIDHLAGDLAPTRDDRLVYEVSLDSGDTIQAQASENDNAAATAEVNLLVDET